MALLRKKTHLVRSQEPFEIDLARTSGDYLFDRSGKKYIDLMMGWCVGNLGWGNRHLRNTIRNYKGPDYVYPQLQYHRWDDLSNLITSLLPGELDACFRTTGGTESVDAAMQIAMVYTGRKKFCSVEDSYHGNSLGTLSIGASENKMTYPNLLSTCHKIKLPLDERSLKTIENRLSGKEYAAFIMEPVILNNGVYIPDKHFMQALRSLCKKYGTLLIIDEVATGFLRTGKFFGFEHFEIVPDIICMSKGITGGYAGLGATVTTTRIANKVRDKISIYSTYGWHPLSTEVAIASISYMVKNQESLTRNIREASQHFRTSFSQMPFRKPHRLSMIGLAISVDVKDERYAEKIFRGCLRDGLLFTRQENKLVLFPSLTITRTTINKALAIIQDNL